MKYMLFVFWAVVLGFWGNNLLDTFLNDLVYCHTLYYVAVVFFAIVLFMWGYSIYHITKYKRSCCWQCLTGEHKTCYKSNQAKIASEHYIKQQNSNHNHTSKQH